MDYRVGKAKDDEPEIKQPQSAEAGVVPKLHFRWILSGPSRSGKSNLAVYSLKNYYKHPTNPKKSFWNQVFLLSPTAHLDYIWQDLPGLEFKNRISKPTPAILRKILQDQIKKITGSTSENGLRNMSSKELARKKQSSDNVLIIFDDAISESSLMNSPEFLKIFIQGRHYGCSSMIMTQSFMRIPRSVRLQATHLSMFPSRSTEIDRIYTEFGPTSMNKKEFAEMIEFATTPQEGDEYPFIHIDAFAPEKTRYRRSFTTVLELKDSKQSIDKPVALRSRLSTRKRKRYVEAVKPTPPERQD
jgi:hypothetical protein